MSKRFPRAQWTLPTVIDPPTRLCVVVPVPDERFHRAAFWGAMLDLASAYKWQDDVAHRARMVALVWRDIVDNLTYSDCAPKPTPGAITLEDTLSSQIRISPDDSCIIQMWCIDHWEDWYDPRNCIATGAGQARARDGEQPPPGSTAQYCQTVQANVAYLYPVQVNAGDVITVDDLGGAWSHMRFGLLSQWYCPDGSTYALGDCGGASTTDAGNPLPAEPDMLLLAYIAGTYYPLRVGSPLNVPAGVVNENMLLVPNTADPTIAQGSISACITIQTVGALPVTVSYLYGSGPTQVSDGGTFIFSSSTVGAEEDLVFTFSVPVKITVLSSDLSVVSGSYPVDYAFLYNPTATLVDTLAWPTTPLTSITPGRTLQKLSISSGSGGAAWSMTVKVDFV